MGSSEVAESLSVDAGSGLTEWVDGVPTYLPT